MHIHGKDAAGDIAMCPGADRRDDLVDDGLIETDEGLADFGGILVSFTTFGDASPASALALERMPVAKQNGLLKYKRTFDIPTNVASRLDQLHIVIHGEDLNHDGHGRRSHYRTRCAIRGGASRRTWRADAKAVGHPPLTGCG